VKSQCKARGGNGTSERGAHVKPVKRQRTRQQKGQSKRKGTRTDKGGRGGGYAGDERRYREIYKSTHVYIYAKRRDEILD